VASTELRVKELLREKGWTTKVLSEKTGMSESYLTHIKNGTRRWNEDALKKLSVAFDVHPIDLFLKRKNSSHRMDELADLPNASSVDLKLSIVPIVGEIPANPSAYNNQLVQMTTGYKEKFIPVFNSRVITYNSCHPIYIITSTALTSRSLNNCIFSFN